MIYRGEIPLLFDADNDDDAQMRLDEIVSLIDWTLIPESYNVAYEDGVFLGRAR